MIFVFSAAVVAMRFPLPGLHRPADFLLCRLELRQPAGRFLHFEGVFTGPEVTDASEEHLRAKCECRAARLIDVRCSGSIKVCLMFVQKDFDDWAGFRKDTN